MAGKQYVSRWLLEMLDSPQYRDEREVKAEQQEIRRNARSHVDKIWEKEARKLNAASPAAPIPLPSWGEVSTNTPVSASAETRPNTETPVAPPPFPSDPGIGVASRLSDDYWANDPRPQGQIETIS